MTKAEKRKLKNLRMMEIESYTVDRTDPVYKQMLKGFLHYDSMVEKEELFKFIQPIVVRFRQGSNCETASERAFWREYLYRQIFLCKFTPEYNLIQQATIEGTIAKCAPYRADFLNRGTKTIIEINGGIHDKQKAYDRERTEKLNELGYTVVPFTNDEIAENVTACCMEVFKIIERRIKKASEAAL